MCQVENNARVGAFMLTLRELTQSFLLVHPASWVAWVTSGSQMFLSWPVLGAIVAALMLAPSWFVGKKRPDDFHLKTL